jgi:dTMP kinase
MNNTLSPAIGSLYKFIVLEGIDGAGKTTVCRALAKSIGAKLFRTPPPGFKATRNHIDSTATLNPRFLFYLCSVAHTSDSIVESLQKRHVVCDRYIVSTVAYHRAFGLKLDWNLDQLNLVQPDFTFFLELANDDERKRRLLARGKYTSADALFDDPTRRRKLLDEYLKYPMRRIDTGSLTVREVVRMIRNQVGF